MRLDNYLVEKGFVESRNKAQTIIKEGLVKVNDALMKKSSFKIEEGDSVRVQEYKKYVSRAAFKLADFLADISLDLAGRKGLDIGSSTGGFTQVLLENGVESVSAVDVGKDQLHHSLRPDTRVSVHESCDIREFHSDERFDIVVSDVAFISLHHILEDIDRLASADIILLFKPQFEVGKNVKRDKNGVVMDKKAILSAMSAFESACVERGWAVLEKAPSKTTGKEGNLEYCYHFLKGKKNV